MTRLVKTIRRSTDIQPAGARRPLVVELAAPGTITIREAGHRKGYVVPLAAVWTLGAKMAAEAARTEKAKTRAARKAAQRAR